MLSDERSSRVRDPLALGLEGEEQFDRLRAALELGDGFELFFLAADSAYVLDELERRLEGGSVPGLAVVPRHHDTAEQLSRLAEDLLGQPPSGSSRSAIWVCGRGSSDEQRASWAFGLGRLNEHRNSLIRQCPHAILMAGPAWLPKLAHDVAPDLWSVRASVFLFPDPPPEANRTLSLRPELPEPWLPVAHELRDGDEYADLAAALAASPRPSEKAARGRLLVKAAAAWHMRGESDRASVALRAALAIWEELQDDRSRALTQRRIADILELRGEIDEALRIRREEELPVFERLGDVGARAVTLGRIARIQVVRGHVDEALKLHQEMLRVFEALGDARSRAVTLGDIARILLARGHVDEALKLHEEMLRVFDALGDARSRAVTLGDIARIQVARGNVDEAMRLHEESLRVFEALGDARERALTLGDIARIQVARGQHDGALKLHEESLRVFEALGDARSRAVTLGDIARIQVARGQVDEALKLHEEMLRVLEVIGDQEGQANTLWDRAQIKLRRNDPGAIEDLARSYQILERIGQAEGIATVGSVLGRILAQTAHRDRALRVLERTSAAFQQLGRNDDARKLAPLIEEVRRKGGHAS
ncbi:MAG: tetratricopeptide repeat protein [Planctomycetes bacterium]|nr:tetratricopeptide repeat protein [Planctomycetota bacterium]